MGVITLIDLVFSNVQWLKTRREELSLRRKFIGGVINHVPGFIQTTFLMGLVPGLAWTAWLWEAGTCCQAVTLFAVLKVVGHLDMVKRVRDKIKKMNEAAPKKASY